MDETRNIRLLRTAFGIVVGLLLMLAAVAVAYQGVAWFQAGRQIQGIAVLFVVGPVLEVITHVIGIKTRGLGRGIMMGVLVGMIVGAAFVAQNDGRFWPAVSIPLFVLFSALFAAWLRERFSSRKES